MPVTLLEKMHVYNLQNEITDEIWEKVKGWDFFTKDTLGKQLTRAFDSIGANIAEGYGRFHYGDKIKFYYYARGSAFESQYWIKRARKRGFFTQEESIKYLTNIIQINKELNSLIKSCKFQKSES
ncbi:MAG: four helix bundle protein [Candidatus Pacebacteria bacterium]|nr:four helix bundle protein [Candidatus Paceibacterota bacterium]